MAEIDCMYNPLFTLTPQLVNILIKIESLKQQIALLPITPLVLAGLRESSRLQSTHYSTKIEGNRLTQEEVQQVLTHSYNNQQREHDVAEVRGYYAALSKIEEFVERNTDLTERSLQLIHALVMGGGAKNVKPSPYRDGQNVIKDGLTGTIFYLPPEAKDVSLLMGELIEWLHNPLHNDLPCPIKAAIAHYQFATIHPYHDGNGRTARLFASWVLHACGYGLKGIYSLEEYYADDLGAYYEALSVGLSHNYYFGRAEADITQWILYFCQGMQESFENVKNQAEKELKRSGLHEAHDVTPLFRKLDARQRQVLGLFSYQESITSRDVQTLFRINDRTARDWCKRWVEENFLAVIDRSKKNRRYALGEEYKKGFANRA